MNEFFIRNIFEFTDQTGDDQIIKINVFYDNIIESGRCTIFSGDKELKFFTKTLAELEQIPESFTFEVQQFTLEAQVSADIQNQQLTLQVSGVPFDQIAKGPREPEGLCRYTDEH